MDVKIPYSKVTDKKEAFKQVKTTVSAEALQSKFGVKAELHYHEDKHQIVAKGKGFDLMVKFLDDGAEIGIDLSFLLKPLKSKIVSVLEKEIGRVL